MQTPTIRQETLTVKSSETDFQQRLKLANLFLWLQDAASSHAAGLGFGYDDLQKQELAWILSRVKVRLLDLPRLGDLATLRTWPKGVQQKLFFMRDYDLTAPDGRLLAAASSAYVLINTRVRRVTLPNALNTPIPDNGGLSAIDEPLEKLAAPAALDPCYTVQVGYSMVDVMGHVNNAVYIDWISDCYSLDEHRSRRPAWLQINYLNEVKAGEPVQLLRGAQPGRSGVDYLTGMNLGSGAKAFEAEMGWVD